MGDWAPRKIYILGLLTFAYCFGEIAHFLIATTSKDVAKDIHYGKQACLQRENGSSEVVCSDLSTSEECLGDPADCEWNYNGQGYDFQVLVGTAYVSVFSTGMLVMGLLLDNFSRPFIFAAGSAVFSLSCLGMGLSNAYWLLVLLRMGIAVGEAVCNPAARSLIADMFEPASRATANGIFSLGVYSGYGLAFIFGLYMADLDILGYGWRVPYVIAGIPGVIIAVCIFFTIKDPREKKTKEFSISSYIKSLKTAFFQPAMLLLTLAAIFRQMCGLSWANNNVNYFNTYYPDTDIGYWLFACSMVGGSSGVIMGGVITDFIQKKLGLHSRLWVQTGFFILALPFSVLTLYLEPPYCFIALMGYYFFSETWFAVLFTVITEIVPAETRAFSVGFFMFTMNMVGGNLVVLVETLTKSIGLRNSIYIFFPGGLSVSAVLFFLTSIPLRRNPPTFNVTEEVSEGTKPSTTEEENPETGDERSNGN